MARYYLAFLPVIRMMELGVTAAVSFSDWPAGLAVSAFWLSLVCGLVVGAMESCCKSANAGSRFDQHPWWAERVRP